MYEAFFEFHSRPFVSPPQTKTYFPGAVIENARQTLTRLIARGEGPGLIIGPPGTGKTLLCQLLGEQFQDQFAVAVLSCGRLKTSQAMLQAVLYELGSPAAAWTRANCGFRSWTISNRSPRAARDSCCWSMRHTRSAGGCWMKSGC